MNGSMLWAALKLDILVQARSRLYSVGLSVAVLMGLLVRFLIPESAKAAALAGFFLLALGGTTYMFSAVIVLWEKSQNTLAAVRVSPMNAATYVASKTLTLTLFATAEAAIVYIVGGGWPVPPGPLLLGALVLGAVYTFLGMAQVAPHDSVTGFLMPDAVLASLLLQLPVFYLIDVGPSWLWHVIPSMPSLLILRSAELELSAGQWGYVVVGSVVALVGSWWLALWRLRRHAGLR